MSDQVSQSAAGIRHLIIENAARDAQIRGVESAETIQITCQKTDQGSGPLLVEEGETARVRGAIVTRATIPRTMAVTVRKAYGDLRVQGLDDNVSIESIAGDLRLSDLRGIVLLAQVDGGVRADGVADLRLTGGCGGDLRFHEGGHLEAESVSGDMRLDIAANVRLERVRGDLWAERLGGKLEAHLIHGDARISDVAGIVAVRDVEGDLRVSAIGGLSASRVAGDAVMHGPFLAGAQYTLSTEGDINVHLPEEPDIQLTARAAGRIRSDPALIPAPDGSPTYTARVGMGSARLQLESGGDLRIRQEGSAPQEKAEQVTNFGDLGDRIRRQVNVSLAAAGIMIEPGELNFRWGDRRRATSTPKSARGAGEQPKPSRVDSASSTSEMNAILKMVEEGVITPEEADRLLNTLSA